MQQMNDIKKNLQEEKYDEAARIFFQLIEDDPDEPLHYINFANLLLELNQLEQAKNFYEAAIEKDANAATAIYGIAQYYYKKGQLGQAATLFQQAISLGLEDSDSYYMLGLCFVQKQPKLALPYLQRAVELNETVATLFQYGLALAQSNYLKEAKDILQKVIEKDDKQADGFYNLGIIAVHENDKCLAEKHFKSALSIQSNHFLAKEALELIETE